MRTIKCLQGDSTWFDEKAGRITSSRVANAIATRVKGTGDLACRSAMKRMIAAEIINGMYMGTSFVTEAMKHGIENEPIARTEYELKSGNDVNLVGLVLHPTIERAAASPDGLIGNDGVLEIKAPTTPTHIDYLIARVVPEEYRDQCMWHLACTEREWVDFVSYDPRMVKKHQLLVVRMHRNEKRIAEMEAAVLTFLSEVDDLVRQLESGENYYVELLQESIAQVSAK